MRTIFAFILWTVGIPRNPSNLPPYLDLLVILVGRPIVYESPPYPSDRAGVDAARPLDSHGERPHDLGGDLPHRPLSERPERRPAAVRPDLRGRAHPPRVPPSRRRAVRARRRLRPAGRRSPCGHPGAAGPRGPREPPRDGGARPSDRRGTVQGPGVGGPRSPPPCLSVRGPRDDLRSRPPVRGRGGRAPEDAGVGVRHDDVLLDPPRSAARNPRRVHRRPPRVRRAIRGRIRPRIGEPRALLEVP